MAFRRNRRNQSRPIEPVANVDAASNAASGEINGDPTPTTEPAAGVEPDLIAGLESVNPTAFDGGDGTSDIPKRRGRKPGSKNRPKVSGNLAGIESLLYSVHSMGAAILSTPELALDKEESKKLADAIATVAQFYDVGVFNPEFLAWFNLAMVAGTIYGPRFMTFKLRKSAERDGQKPKLAAVPKQEPQKTNGTPSPFNNPFIMPQSAVVE